MKQLWCISHKQTNKVYSKVWKYGDIIERELKNSDIITVKFDNDEGKIRKLNYLYYNKLGKINYVEPWINPRFKYLKDRGVRYLIHFTPLSNINSIFQKGLLPRSELENIGTFTDAVRLDGHMDAISCSISFPNYQMFYKKRKKDDEKFAVLCIDISILNCIDPEKVAYFPNNAACNEMKCHGFSEMGSLEAVKSMFVRKTNVIQQKDTLPDSFPTDPQAEVMIKAKIPWSAIKEVHIHPDDYDGFYNDFCDISIKEKIKRSKEYFVPRTDWSDWKKEI